MPDYLYAINIFAAEGILPQVGWRSLRAQRHLRHPEQAAEGCLRMIDRGCRRRRRRALATPSRLRAACTPGSSNNLVPQQARRIARRPHGGVQNAAAAQPPRDHLGLHRLGQIAPFPKRARLASKP